MKRIYFFCIGILSIFFFASCTSEVSIHYTIDIIDIDGENIGSYNVKTKDKSSFFDDLKKKCSVVYEESEYGPFIKQINHSIMDSNYYLALYKNDKLSEVGVSSITVDEGDHLKFIVENFKNYDQIDIKVDQVVYGFYKKAEELYKNIDSIDCSLLMAYKKLIDFDYNIDMSFVPASFKTSLENIEYKELTRNDFFKIAMCKYALQQDLSCAKEIILEKNYDVLYGNYVSTMNAFLYCLMCLLEVKPDHLSAFENYLKDYMKNPELGDSGCMTCSALSLFKEFDSYKESFISLQKTSFTEQGVDLGYGANACSTAQAVIAFCNMNENIRDEKYKINGIDMIEALLTYVEEDFTVLGYDGKTDLYFNTPQTLSALMCYKAVRDRNKAVNLYA